MIIFPAIDIKDNECVRLTQGDYRQKIVYSNQPEEVAVRWEKEGAPFLHLVDLDGAKDGYLYNKSTIEKIVKSVSIPVQLGGGIRDEATASELLALGINRVILGTVAVENLSLVKQLVEKYGAEKIVVSIDATNGKVATRGWKNISEVDALTLCQTLEEVGITTIVYTDILRDGMLQGPNLEIYKELAEKTNLQVIASGGIGSLKDIKELASIGLYGTIVGKALYEEKVDLKEVLSCLQKGSSRA
ncbi:1-(5-phosphoribosyl)-5-[(5-phosphoribosylamino)methylideneamino]imidazole-4-carboxamide isomerase [Lottiidibacillus patelloidae]|uniref:1-(5-phosphoribosyl)-5-[(5-phosphoribosylamino)methylideneamino] imidazole-4-carboxamide isomerase n=1 Tax=Lottiidibacillus patelloidae TaxID=2670334 RepID=A0A263BTE3_9BACI|nr:1-(5-phosphoribosyl)-5-[(5-phosphoribosylamino)methylideneamino]imidazole-4-carboxamide isomerase [Lottiidibacillus patelloidae]OZM56994.1 1-(5-phosphoribosyl)-5-[(5-phosphoribosylamino)methylideneamino]imidazole-4-carboxamide isomerase [Lottiidibacillus patelloidae]